MLYLASDHGGFALKERIKQYLTEKNVPYKDYGAEILDAQDDYPDYAIPAIKDLENDLKNGRNHRAVLLCKNGVGVSIVANKHPGIRCCLSWNPEHVKTAREDDDCNVLALPAEFINEEQALEILETWLKTDFSNEERHIRRLKKVAFTRSDG